MFMNRWLCRQEIVEVNGLTPGEETAVFGVLKPLQGEGGAARYLETEADEVIAQVRRGRPRSPSQLYVREEEDLNMTDFSGVMEPFGRIADAIERLIETLAPKTAELVGTDYIARRLGCSTQWVAKMAENGDIPKACIAPRISGGRIWKFHREKIEAWLREREEG